MQRCPDGCHGNQFCKDSRCVCELGFGGYDCDVELCPGNCSYTLGQGECSQVERLLFLFLLLLLLLLLLLGQKIAQWGNHCRFEITFISESLDFVINKKNILSFDIIINKMCIIKQINILLGLYLLHVQAYSCGQTIEH